MTYFIQWSAI